jgi:hypothetical protein
MVPRAHRSVWQSCARGAAAMRKRSLQPTRVTPDPRPRQKQQNRCSGVPIIQTRLRKVPPEREREEAAVPEAIERLISRGPPAGSGIPFEAWRSWHHYGFIACPASKLRHTCSDHCCRMGADCRELRALGLKGNCMPLPRKERPICGACNRQGKPCGVRVEPGKRRCRFHGGLSTGPKTTAGRAKIAEAQRRRWSAFRAARGEAVPVNRIEPRIVPHEPDPDLLADAQRLEGRPPDEHGQRRKLSGNVRRDRQ